MEENMEIGLVTEVGTFGELNMEDPTVINTKKKKTELEALIESSIDENLKNLSVISE